MRSRWAAAVVVLASMLLLHLCAPALAAGPRATVHPAAVSHGEAVPAAPEGVFTPSPDGADTSVHRLLARSPRSPGTAGAHPPAPGAPPAATAEPRTAASRPLRPPQRRGPGDAVRTVTALQTFRC
ncbi:hypothetical protein [Streptomyces viridosporus]|uniref:hypothetical protein n=1 Tax=Streptomyces viridosporus TaxID=67581 RepID=UPI0009BED7B1|nr:hypothetical protein [Streptomyces viridosporus]